MKLNELFNMQKALDDHIKKEKGLEGQDLLDKKILALQVELGELAQNWRGFKFWSEDQRARGEDEYLEYRPIDQGGSHWVRKNPLLEEYVDCLHFILSIGKDLNMADDVIINFRGFKGLKSSNIVRQINEIFYFVSRIQIDKDDYYDAAMEFLDLGEMLGFTWEQIEQAYISKNEINHQRQEGGY